MHELSYVLAAVRRGEAVCRAHGGGRPLSVTLQIGAMSGLLPGAIEACWQEATKATLLEGAALRLETAPAQAKCLGCGQDFSPAFPALRCPACGCARFSLLTGDDLVIKELALTV